MGDQFLNLLIQFYSEVSFTKQTVFKILTDIMNINEYIVSFNNDKVKSKYNSLKALIYLYIVDNT